MKKIKLIQVFELEVPEALSGFSEDEIIRELNVIYDVQGKGIVINSDYIGTIIDSIDDEEILRDGQCIFLEGL